MTTNHAAPWTFRQFMADLFKAPTKRTQPAVLTGREATARHLFGESCQWSKLDMLDYDNSPILRGGWLAEADRRIAGGTKTDLPDMLALRHWGYTPAQWAALPNEIRTAKRAGYFQSMGLGA